MPSIKLSQQQVEKIEEDVRHEGINFSHLEADLIDHICCYVEELMSNGESFDKAYIKAKKSIGFSHLKEIEIKTILLVNQKFKTMKTLMKVSGISGFGLFLIGLFMKIKHLEGAGIVFTLAFLILLAAYLPALTLTVRKERILANKMPLFYFGVISVFFALLLFVFAMNHWPGKSFLLAGSWVSFLLFIIMFFQHTLKNQENRIINLSILLVLSVFLLTNAYSYALSTMSPVAEVTVIEYNLDEAFNYFEKKVAILEKDLESPSIDSNRKKESAELIYFSDQFVDKIELVRNGIFSDSTELRNYNKKFFKYTQKTDDVQKGIHMLAKDIGTYKDFVITIVDDKENPELITLIERSLALRRFDMYSKSIVLYNNLTRLKRDIRLIEAELLQAEI